MNVSYRRDTIESKNSIVRQIACIFNDFAIEKAKKILMSKSLVVRAMHCAMEFITKGLGRVGEIFLHSIGGNSS